VVREEYTMSICNTKARTILDKWMMDIFNVSKTFLHTSLEPYCGTCFNVAIAMYEELHSIIIIRYIQSDR
jgi:hypothetical protein